jgi:hypothetical protein
MKYRALLYTLIGSFALIIGLLWFYLERNKQENLAVFPATINRDCAPWDGAAFTLSVRYDPATTLIISIWESPDLKFPSTFSFPDETGQFGQVYILSELDPLIQLSGKVFFWRVEQGSPVEGEFDLKEENGKYFKGNFKAEWGSFVAMCG